MAHTDKDRPLWVTDTATGSFTEQHFCTPNGRTCDIDSVLSAAHPYRWCERVPRGRARRHGRNGLRRVERRNDYWAPERSNAREVLQRFRSEARLDGRLDDLDDELHLTEQHRHGVFGGGWWD